MDNDDEAPRLLRALRSMCTINPATRAQELNFVRWVVIWGLSYIGAQVLLRHDLVSGPLAWLLPGISVIIAMVAFQRYYHFLSITDELTRKIQSDGACFAFGFAVLGTLILQAFEPLGMPQPDNNDMVTMMVIAWVVGQFMGHWKYQ